MCVTPFEDRRSTNGIRNNLFLEPLLNKDFIVRIITGSVISTRRLSVNMPIHHAIESVALLSRTLRATNLMHKYSLKLLDES